MKLELASGRVIRKATLDDILGRIDDEEFAILSTGPESYLQCAKQEGSRSEYELEYRDGSEHKHFRAADGPITLDRVISAFVGYFHGDTSWRSKFRWERIVSGGTGFVQIRNGKVSITASTASELKLALKELKLKKKEISLQKRSINEQAKAIRAAYTQNVRTRGSMVRGGGGLGRLVRFFQRASRDNTRSHLAKDLAPLERQVQDLEAIIRAVDELIIKVEAHLLNSGGA